MLIFFKLIIESTQFLSKHQPAVLKTKIDEIILKFTSKCKEPRKAKTVLKMRNKVGDLILPDFKTYCKSAVIRTMWYWHKVRHIDQ